MFDIQQKEQFGELSQTPTTSPACAQVCPGGGSMNTVWVLIGGALP
jgi:hypothetical protein